MQTGKNNQETGLGLEREPSPIAIIFIFRACLTKMD